MWEKRTFVRLPRRSWVERDIDERVQAQAKQTSSNPSDTVDFPDRLHLSRNRGFEIYHNDVKKISRSMYTYVSMFTPSPHGTLLAA